MKKYLDILIFTLLFFFIFSYFSGKDDQVALSGLSFETSKQSYSVPAGVGLTLTNNTSELLTVDTCKDISLRYSGEELPMPESLCETRELTSREVLSIDFAPHYDIFENPGSYTFEYSKDSKQYLQQIQVEYRGVIGKTFIGLFYAPMFNLLAYL